MNETETGRLLLENLLKNTHESLKWAWQIVMGFSMVVAVHSCYVPFLVVLDKLGIVSLESYAGQTPTVQTSMMSLVLFFVVFMPTFVRFFYGDNRYLDLHYLELTHLANTKGAEEYLSELTQFSGRRRMTDILLLMTHGMIFIFLGNACQR